MTRQIDDTAADRRRRAIAAVAASLLALVVALLVLAPEASARNFYTGSYSTDMESSTPIVTSPASGTVLDYPSEWIELQWRAVPGARLYRVEMAVQNSSSADCSVANTAFQSDKVVVRATTRYLTWVPTLTGPTSGEELENGTYCWRVRAHGSSAGEWSEGRRLVRQWTGTPTNLLFYNDSDGEIPRTSSDSDYGTGSTLTRNSGYLTWDAVDGAETYEVQVASSDTFQESSNILRVEGRRGTRLLLPQLPDDDYAWRVRAVAPDGSTGPWSAKGNLRIERFESIWSDGSLIYPAYGAATSDLTAGWNPVPGASHYEVQFSTHPGCFWEYNMGQTPPVAWGTDGGTGPSFCRLSDADPEKFKTINNWASIKMALSDETISNIHSDLCAAPPCGGTYLPLGVDGYEIFWRVRPVWRMTQETETGWEVAGDFDIYGGWLVDESAGYARPYKLTLDEPTPGDYVSAGARCDSPLNALAPACASHVASEIAPGTGQADSTTMQVPALQWSPFIGQSGEVSPGGWRVQIARDPFFNSIVHDEVQPRSLGGMFYGMQERFALPSGLPDNEEGTGYWWRVVPCHAANEELECVDSYYQGAAGVPSGIGISPSFADQGTAQMFTKRVEVDTRVKSSFAGSTPMLQVGPLGASTAAEWGKGVQGADHYEFQLARNGSFTSGDVTFKTTVPRLVPYTDTGEPGTLQELADGVWFWRVRPIDKDGLAGSWSDVSSFDKRVSTPSVVTGSGTPSGTGVTVSWNPIDGADYYQVQWDTDVDFGSPSTATTRQVAYHVSPSTPGVYYWRVRASFGDVSSDWTSVSTSGPKVEIQGKTEIRYRVSRFAVPVGQGLYIEGELSAEGDAVSGESLLFQRKDSACDAPGTYVTVGGRTTGMRGEDGTAALPITADRNRCWRLAWIDGAKVHFSAPIKTTARPITRMGIARGTVTRGQRFCGRISSNATITGRARMQYRMNGIWRTATSANVYNMRGRWLCARINRAGIFRTRLGLDRMRISGGWQSHLDTYRLGRIMRVNDVWTIY